MTITAPRTDFGMYENVGIKKLNAKSITTALKKLANWVLTPLLDITELLVKEAVSGIQPKNEQKIEPIPRAIIS